MPRPKRIHRRIFCGTRCRSGTKTRIPCRFLARYSPHGRADCTKGWCWAAAWPPRLLPRRVPRSWAGILMRAGLQKVKNNFAAAEYRRLSSNMAILMHLIQNDGEGDWHEINNAGPKIQAVTAADVKRVANKYFTKENRCVAIYTRKPGASIRQT